ncbi:MAG: hypothetical protein WC730_03695 [Patescibacteria group bacterium]|jgi:hypothetical protein
MPIQFKISTILSAFRSFGLLTMGLLLANLLLGGFYIWHVNAAQTAGYTLRELEEQNEDSLAELSRLNIEVAKLESIDSVSTRIQMLGLTKVSNVVYLSSRGSEVAMK